MLESLNTNTNSPLSALQSHTGELNLIEKEPQTCLPYYLSVVAASRNDDHGGNTLYRTQIFVDSFLQQCERYKLRAELILVEWNPPSDRAALAEVIDWSHQNRWVDCKVITVPYKRHILLRYGRVLPLFQMIAKNVGIRRARGEFILATNIDILLSNELINIFAKKTLRPDRHYRCDRFDINSEIPKNVSLDEKLQFARENVTLCYRRKQPQKVATLQASGAHLDDVLIAALETGNFEMEIDDKIVSLTARSDIPLRWLHLFACGDFALMHRDAWTKMGGYAEFETFSLNLDALGLMTAHRLGFRETWFPPPAVCYHIEHAVGSGFNPQNSSPMFERLKKQGIGWLTPGILNLIIENESLQFNTEQWGLRDIPMDETLCTCEGLHMRTVASSLQADPYAAVTALRPEFSGDQYFRKAIQQEKDKLKKYRNSWANLLKTARDRMFGDVNCG